MSESPALAERIARIAHGLGIQTTLIGAAACAVHNYVRGTEDVDLATNVRSGAYLRQLEEAVRALGLDVIRSTAGPFDRTNVLETLIAEARAGLR